MTARSLPGLALILGTLGYLFTMALHPAGMFAGALAGSSQIMGAVHALGLLSLPVVLFGLIGLSSRTGWQRPATQFALVCYCLAVVAAMIAAIASGLIGPALLQKQMGASGDAFQAVHMVLEFNYQLNQACAKVFVVGASLAIVAWSNAISGLGNYERRVAWLGWFVGLGSVAALFSGHVRMSVHGFGAIVMLQAIWNMCIGVSLLRDQKNGTGHRSQ